MMIYLQLLETEEDKVTFEQLYLEYRGLMYHIAYDILHNKEDAEDAVHQAFLSIINHFKKIRQMERPQMKAFFVIVVERKALDTVRLRARNADSYDIEECGVEIPLPGDNGMADAMARLSARYREVLLLRFHFGYSPREISEIFQISHAATKKLIWRAKSALAEALTEGDEPFGRH